MKTLFLLFLYHLSLIIASIYSLYNFPIINLDKVWINAAFLGMLGGVVYCARALYLNYCVRKEWDDRWILWHIIRPFISLVCGAISLLFVKAGLLLFEADDTSQSHYGSYALAFIAGLNVDNFLKKIEDVFKSLMGINKTRQNQEESK